jgi:hypothetical protein
MLSFVVCSRNSSRVITLVAMGEFEGMEGSALKIEGRGEPGRE